MKATDQKFPSKFMEEKSIDQPKSALNKYRTRDIVKKIKSLQHFVYLYTEKGKFYLPPINYLTWEYVGEILSGQKKLLKAYQINSNFKMPKSKGMSVNGLFDELKTDQEFMMYFPKITEKMNVPREYFFNVFVNRY